MKPELPEPLFLLHSGANYGYEQDDWDVEANSGQLVDAVCAHYPNQTIGLHDEKIVQSLIDRAYEAGKADAREWLPIVPWNGGWAIRPEHEAANAFWAYWKANGETHIHGYYESTWGAINRALKAAIPPPPTQRTEGGDDHGKN